MDGKFPGAGAFKLSNAKHNMIFIRKQMGLYQSKANFILVSMYNCKMGYSPIKSDLGASDVFGGSGGEVRCSKVASI